MTQIKENSQNINGEIVLVQLRIKLACKDDLRFQMSSQFHGALMELVPTEFAEAMHVSQLHPYAQHLEKNQDEWFWIVAGLTEQAENSIIYDALSRQEKICLKGHGITVALTEKQYLEKSKEELIRQFYQETGPRYLQIEFVSPTAFRQKGRYVFFPDMRCMYQSLMNKLDACTENECLSDEETLEQLCRSTELVRYNLKSVHFHLEGTRIPAFVGKITLKFNGTQTMASFANMLFTFGNFSGVGIKTSLGMGAIRILNGGER